jgi:hypothetical protein
MVPPCLTRLPDELRKPLLAFASAWAESPHRPRVRPEIVRAWDALLDEWIRTPSLPLFVRKDSERKNGPRAHGSGRTLIPCDNSPAVWAFTLALEGICPSLAEVADAVANGRIPVGLTQLGKFDRFYKAGWKLAHVVGVGLRTQTPLQQLPLARLQEHCRLLLSPSNHFAIPKVWAGLGEVPEVIEVIRTVDGRTREEAGGSAGIPGGEVTEPAPLPLPRKSPPPAPEEQRRTAVPRANTYRATRLLFRADVIEGLDDDESFRIETPEGAFEMTAAEFRETFPNVVESAAYRVKGLYSYSQTPRKALQYLV